MHACTCVAQAIARFAAVNIVGAEGVTIDDCLFERLDGNGLSRHLLKFVSSAAVQQQSSMEKFTVTVSSWHTYIHIIILVWQAS